MRMRPLLVRTRRRLKLGRQWGLRCLHTVGRARLIAGEAETRNEYPTQVAAGI